MIHIKPLIKEKEEITEKINALRERYDHIDDMIHKDRNQSYIGRYFKYRNSYSDPTSLEDYWWMYIKIHGSDGKYLRGFSFETDVDGITTIQDNEFTVSVERYSEITKDEFDNAYQDLIKRLTHPIKGESNES